MGRGPVFRCCAEMWWASGNNTEIVKGAEKAPPHESRDSEKFSYFLSVERGLGLNRGHESTTHQLGTEHGQGDAFEFPS